MRTIPEHDVDLPCHSAGKVVNLVVIITHRNLHVSVLVRHIEDVRN